MLRKYSRRDGRGAWYGFGDGLWHDERMVARIMIAVHLFADAVRFSILLMGRSRRFGVNVLKSPLYSPKANAICERVIGTNP